MRSIAIGPEVNLPSWNWVGFDTARELSKYYDVRIYRDFDAPPADVTMVIKRSPDHEFVHKVKSRGSKLIYCPIDFIKDKHHVSLAGPIMTECDLVISHCKRLTNDVRDWCKRIEDIEHNNKYMLNEMREYKADGFVLWIGGCQYVPFLLAWLQAHPIPHKVVILTNHLEPGSGLRSAADLARHLRVPFNVRQLSINGIQTWPWCERTQQALLYDCKAAIDIKGHDYNQSRKPATKGQKYVASGIPFAANAGCYAIDYLAAKGLKVVSPDDPHWFTEAYWAETKEAGLKVREETSLENIGRQYRDMIESLFAG